MNHSVNKVILIGNVGRDPEIKHFKDTEKIATISLATSESYRNKSTLKYMEKVEWHKIVVFNPKIIEYLEKSVSKGTKIYVEGQLKTREWIDAKTQEKKYMTEVVVPKFGGELVVLSSKEKEASLQAKTPIMSLDQLKERSLSFGCTSPQKSNIVVELDDEIPF